MPQYTTSRQLRAANPADLSQIILLDTQGGTRTGTISCGLRDNVYLHFSGDNCWFFARQGFVDPRQRFRLALKILELSPHRQLPLLHNSLQMDRVSGDWPVLLLPPHHYPGGSQEARQYGLHNCWLLALACLEHQEELRPFQSYLETGG